MNQYFPYREEEYKLGMHWTPQELPSAARDLSTAIATDLRNIFLKLYESFDLNRTALTPTNYEPAVEEKIQTLAFYYDYLAKQSGSVDNAPATFSKYGEDLIFENLRCYLDEAPKSSAQTGSPYRSIKLEAWIRALVLAGQMKDAWRLTLQRSIARYLSNPAELPLKTGKGKASGQLQRQLAMLVVAHRLLKEQKIPTKSSLHARAQRLIGQQELAEPGQSKDRKEMEIFMHERIPKRPGNSKFKNNFYNQEDGTFCWSRGSFHPPAIANFITPSRNQQEANPTVNPAKLMLVESWKPSGIWAPLYWHILRVFELPMPHGKDHIEKIWSELAWLRERLRELEANKPEWDQHKIVTWNCQEGPPGPFGLDPNL